MRSVLPRILREPGGTPLVGDMTAEAAADDTIGTNASSVAGISSSIGQQQQTPAPTLPLPIGTAHSAPSSANAQIRETQPAQHPPAFAFPSQAVTHSAEDHQQTSTQGDGSVTVPNGFAFKHVEADGISSIEEALVSLDKQLSAQIRGTRRGRPTGGHVGSQADATANLGSAGHTPVHSSASPLHSPAYGRGMPRGGPVSSMVSNATPLPIVSSVT